MNTFDCVREVLARVLEIPEQDISAQTLLSDLIHLSEPAPVIIEGVDHGMSWEMSSHFFAAFDAMEIAEELNREFAFVVSEDDIAEELFEAVRGK